MATEMDELVTRAANDGSMAEDEIREIIIAVIAKTRQSWATISDEYLLPEAPIGVGLGYAALTRDGVAIYEDHGKRCCDRMTVVQAEDLARREPASDWRIHLVAQLDNRHYKREAPGLRVLYERGYGMS